MPIFEMDDDTPIGGVIGNTSTINTAVVVDKDTPIAAMMQYIEGENWSVEYYNGLKREDDFASTMDVNSSIVDNQYTLIHKLNLKVSSPLTAGSLDTLEGSAIIPVDIVPMVGDLFTATLMTGEIGIFLVTNVVTKSYNFKRAFTIQYRLDSTNTVSDNLLAELNERVVRELTFVEDIALEGGNPLLLGSDLVAYDRLGEVFNALSDLYFHKFKHKSGYLVSELEGESYLDPYATYIYHIVSGDLVGDFSVLNIEEDIYKLVRLLTVDCGEIPNYEMFISDNVPVSGYQKARTREHIPFSIKKILTTSQTLGRQLLTISGNSVHLPTFIEGNSSYPIELESSSTLELLFINAVKCESIDKVLLLNIVDDVDRWTDLELYRYLPILLYLIKTERKRVRSVI